MPLIEPVAKCRKFNSLSRHAQWFYLQLKLHLDPAGRHDAHPSIINSTLFPLRKDVRDTDISRWLRDCEQAGLLRCYGDPQGRAVLQVFDARQSRMKSIKSEFAPPEGQMPLLSEADVGQQKRSEKKRREEHAREADSSPKSKIQSPKPSEPPRNPLEVVEGILNEIYKRTANSRWSYAEQSALAEVSTREEVIPELEHILAWRRAMAPDDRRRFFPQSVNSLLTNWTEALDKARVQCPARHPKSEIRNPKSETRSEPVSEQILRDSIAYLERERPGSPLLEMQRKQLAKLMSKA